MLSRTALILTTQALLSVLHVHRGEKQANAEHRNRVLHAHACIFELSTLRRVHLHFVLQNQRPESSGGTLRQLEVT